MIKISRIITVFKIEEKENLSMLLQTLSAVLYSDFKIYFTVLKSMMWIKV